MAPSPETLRGQLQAMDEYAFEHFIAELWELQGWNTEVKQQSGDAGIDVIAERSDPATVRQVIQAKRYSDENKIGGPDIQQYASLDRQVQGASSVVVVTTGKFTKAAFARAKEHEVQLVDGQDLERLIDEMNAYDLVEKYVDDAPIVKSNPSAAAVTNKGSNAADSAKGLLAYAITNPEDTFQAIISLIVFAILIYVLLQILSTLYNIPVPF